MNGQWEGKVPDFTRQNENIPQEQQEDIALPAASTTLEEIARKYEEAGILPPLNME